MNVDDVPYVKIKKENSCDDQQECDDQKEKTAPRTAGLSSFARLRFRIVLYAVAGK
jgi:hypothetical protein